MTQDTDLVRPEATDQLVSQCRLAAAASSRDPDQNGIHTFPLPVFSEVLKKNAIQYLL